MNNYHIQSTCRAQHLGRYLEGQGHSMIIAAKSCQAHHFVIWSRILKIFYRNDHHIETTCRAQHLCYLEGQCHSMTLQQNCGDPITLLFEGEIYSYVWQTTLSVQYLFGEHYPLVYSGPRVNNDLVNTMGFMYSGTTKVAVSEPIRALGYILSLHNSSLGTQKNMRWTNDICTLVVKYN